MQYKVADVYQEAQRVLNSEGDLVHDFGNPVVPIFLRWKDETYLASITEVMPFYSREIVLLYKEEAPVQDELVKTIKELSPERLELKIESDLDISGQDYYLLKLGEDELGGVTSSQSDAIDLFLAEPINEKSI